LLRVISTRNGPRAVRVVSALLTGTILGGMATPVFAQATDQAPAAQAPASAATEPQPAAVPGAAPVVGTIRAIDVTGSQRLEPDTVRSYVKLRAGGSYTREDLDQAIKDLYATELFADVVITDRAGTITIAIKENPIINRIVLEGNKRIKEDKIRPEIKLAPRQIFTRSKVRADVARIIELYKRQGRFAAAVEPKMVMLDQNRVDVVFEVSEGAKSRVRQINIIGNEKFSDDDLRSEMYTKQARLFRIFSSGTSYDPDRLAADQQKLRQFYLTNGYADFTVVSAIAELTPDRRDFIITYVVQEGERYKFGDVKVESNLRDFRPEQLRPQVPIKAGDWYNAKLIEDTVDKLTETAGLIGYAFADVQPDFLPDKEKRIMNVTFKVADAPRVYVERIDINGNTHTQDKVIRREFRLAEGDAFNSFRVKRSTDRIKSLGYFQENLEIDQKQGSTADRVVLTTNVEEKSTGELQISAGFSSLERFIVDLSIRERNFMGKGQELRAGVSYSYYSKSIELGFSEPYLFDKNIAVGFDVFRRDYNSFNYIGDDRETTYKQVSTGFQLRGSVPLTEYWSMAFRYGLSYDQVSLDKSTFYSQIGSEFQCDPLRAGRYLCDAIGDRITSFVGYTVLYDNLNNRIRPTAGERFVFSQDFAGLGGDVKYLRTTANAAKYWDAFAGFIFSLRAEAGYIKSLNGDQVLLTDRFQLGEPQMRGFDIRGVGPRVIRRYYGSPAFDDAGNPQFVDQNNRTDDALGGNAYYVGHAELEIPLGAGAREMGLRPSLFADVGAVFSLRKPELLDLPTGAVRQSTNSDGLPLYRDKTGTVTTDQFTNGQENLPITTTSAAFREFYYGNSAKPRLSVGFGVNWNSPFGPFRIDIAKALLKEEGDDTKLITFNVGTQF
jgi:outer membrane protein insertion porin family